MYSQVEITLQGNFPTAYLTTCCHQFQKQDSSSRLFSCVLYILSSRTFRFLLCSISSLFHPSSEYHQYNQNPYLWWYLNFIGASSFLIFRLYCAFDMHYKNSVVFERPFLLYWRLAYATHSLSQASLARWPCVYCASAYLVNRSKRFSLWSCPRVDAKRP